MSPSTIVSLCLSKVEKQPAVLDTSLVFSFYWRAQAATWKCTPKHMKVAWLSQKKRCVGSRRARGALHSVSPTFRWKYSHHFIALPSQGWQKQGWVGRCADFRVAACSCLPCFPLQEGDTEPRAGTTSCPSALSSEFMHEVWVAAYTMALS